MVTIATAEQDVMGSIPGSDKMLLKFLNRNGPVDGNRLLYGKCGCTIRCTSK